jgi:TRAP-type C4-dicarboxylate transport system permease small subunit
MIRILWRAKNGLVKLLEGALSVAVGALVLDVLWQVIARFVMRRPSPWTEELARMLLIWVSLLGASVAYARKGHLGVDYFVGLLPTPAKRLVEFAGHALVIFFASAVMMYGGWQMVVRTLSLRQLSPALQIEMGHVYLAIPISGFFIVLFALEAIVESFSASRPELLLDKEGA